MSLSTTSWQSWLFAAADRAARLPRQAGVVMVGLGRGLAAGGLICDETTSSSGGCSADSSLMMPDACQPTADHP